MRWCEKARGCSCSVQRTVVTRAHRNIIAQAYAAWLEGLCQWGRVVVVVHCSAAECDHCRSQRPTRDLHCPLTSDEAHWRRWMFSVDDQWRLLHSPTHNGIYWILNVFCVGLPLATGVRRVKKSTPSCYFHDSAQFTPIVLYTKVIAQTDNC